jgi:hypothetical protein
MSLKDRAWLRRLWARWASVLLLSPSFVEVGLKNEVTGLSGSLASKFENVRDLGERGTDDHRQGQDLGVRAISRRPGLSPAFLVT